MTIGRVRDQGVVHSSSSGTKGGESQSPTHSIAHVMPSKDSKASGSHVGPTKFAILVGALRAFGTDTRIGEPEFRTDTFHVEFSLEIANQNFLFTGKVHPMRKCLQKVFHVDFATGKLHQHRATSTLGVSDKPIVRIVLDELSLKEVFDQESTLDTIISRVFVDMTLEELDKGKSNRWVYWPEDRSPGH